jgi:predicted TIM-barrel fold metal-dependent hydrolase
MLIDTHLHIIDRNALRYAWIDSTPALNHDFLMATYAQQARRVGISQSMHMEVDVTTDHIEREIDFVGGLAEAPDSLLIGAIAACRPEDPGFPAFLDRQRGKPLIKGFRRVLHVMPDDLSDSSLFRDHLKLLSGTGLTFDLCMLPRQLDRAMALIDHAPDVQFVLDHCGVPDVAGDAREPWGQRITELAQRPNVIAKISGIVAYAKPDSWTVETLRPWVEHTIHAFGWNRVVWGSDWPVCTLGGSLSTWVAATHALVAGASPDERTALFSGNAKRVWRI